MERLIGTVSMGIRAPIITKGDNIAEIVVDSVLNAVTANSLTLHEKDVIAVTEAVVARAQGNYVSTSDIASDIKSKFGDSTIGVIFPILSRNRFATCLRGIAMGAKKIVLMLSYPSDEVGNHLVSIDELDEKGINPWTDVLTESTYRTLFGEHKHTFTGVDYIKYYREVIEECGCEVEIILANDARAILNYTKNILCCDIHTRVRTKRLLTNTGAKLVYSLDEIMTSSINGSGCNEDYGLLGSNKATENTIKLFPRDCQTVVDTIQSLIYKKTNTLVEAMIYGDGAFKDPVGKIWELADPVVSPAYTSGLTGQPNEIKLKYIADNEFPHLKGEALQKAISEYIEKKSLNLTGNSASLGTTPRQLTDLIGSLCDLTSGSGDKGTPIILVQGYFDNYSYN